MRIHRTLTDVGRGVLEREACELALLSERRVYRDLEGTREQTVSKWLAAVRVEARPWTWQVFDSPEARQAYLDVQLNVHELREPEQEADSALLRVYHPAQELVESVVWSVSFIGDFLSIEFDAGKLEVYDWPRYAHDWGVQSASEPGYRDTLWDLLDRCVVAVDECLDAGLVLRFMGGGAIHVPLGEGSPLARLAAATFRRHTGETYVWPRGEAPFAKGSAA